MGSVLGPLFFNNDIRGVNLKLIMGQNFKLGQSYGATLIFTKGITVYAGITVGLFIWTQASFAST